MDKINFKTLSLLTLTMLVSGCGNSNVITGFTQGDDLAVLSQVQFDYEHAVFDDFANGVSIKNWYIANQAWGGSNGGVIPNNVNYTDDGVLVLSGNGNYYADHDVRGVGDVKDGRFTGAALVSKFRVHAGRYEIKMKVLPRLGACTAFWIYAYDSTTDANHEIDIELPGGNKNHFITFENVLNTNYVTEAFKHSQDTLISSVKDDNEEVFLNDGEWHVFGFDWYTDPELVVYYVDGKVTAVSDVFVPNMEARLWLGCWFPVASAFVGSADFEKDNMYVDYVKYIPFANQPYQEYDPPFSGYALENEYPTSPIPAPNINKVSNGNFENLPLELFEEGEEDMEKDVLGWHLTKRLVEDKAIKEVIKVEDGVGFDDSKALVVSDNGIIYQLIDSVYHNFQYDFSFYAKGNGRVSVIYFGKNNTDPLEIKTIDVNTLELTMKTLSLVAPEGAQSIRINIESSEGNSLLVDNVSMLRK